MSKLEEAAKAYASCEVSEGGLAGLCGIEAGKYEPFIAGAEWQAKQSPWIRAEERLPEDNELVLTSSSIYGTKLLVWNDHYKVWDDEDGDDVYCERDKIDAWMPIPE